MFAFEGRVEVLLREIFGIEAKVSKDVSETGDSKAEEGSCF